MKKQCKIDGCKFLGKLDKNGNRTFVKGYCNMHYQKYYKYGEPLYIIRASYGDRTNHELYNIHMSMRQRCYNINRKDYNRYGGRGIKVCDRRLGPYGFDNFLSDMGDRPEGMSIDRIDNNGNYEPNNCRRATNIEQISNRRNTLKYAGVYLDKRRNKRYSYITLNKKKIHLGTYINYEDAVKSRKIADGKYKTLLETSVENL